jgi:hypothetical protein
MKATDQTILVGYEVGTGAPVEIPVRHMTVTGQTQESGKTTTLEALITRSKRRAVAFVTKRGEGAFVGAREIAPFFQERADWEFVEAILESSLKQRMKFERSWIVRACEGAKTLADVRVRAAELRDRAKGSMNQDMFMLLGKYLDKVVPLIERLPKSPLLLLTPGLNVMNLVEYPQELQMLVIASTLRFVHEQENGVISVVPEAWKMIPQGKNTPVKTEVVKLVREGAGLGNYVWYDAQDLAVIDKELLRGAPVWVIGVQRETNEIKRTLENMEAAGVGKPKARDIARLGIGEFFVCYGEVIKKTYVLPAWSDERTARAVARGELSVKDVQARKPAAPKAVKGSKEAAVTTGNTDLVAALNNLADAIRGTQVLAGGAPAAVAHVDEEKIVEQVFRRVKDALAGRGGSQLIDVTGIVKAAMKQYEGASMNGHGAPVDVDEIVGRVLERLPQPGEAGAISVEVAVPSLEVTKRRHVLRVDDSTLQGRVARLYAEGFFRALKNAAQVQAELIEVGFIEAGKNEIRDVLDTMTRAGFFRREAKANGSLYWKAIPGVESNIVEE